MRILPVAIFCWIEKDPVKRMELLQKEVLKSAMMTHRSVLGIVPAFSLAYLLMEWLDPTSNPNKLFRYSVTDQLKHVARATQQFEQYLAQFMQNEPHISGYSSFLSILSQHEILKSQEISVEDKFSMISKYCLDIASKFVFTLPSVFDISDFFWRSRYTTHSVDTINDGFAFASVTSALIGALLFKEKPFLGTLKFMYHQGGDTDTGIQLDLHFSLSFHLSIIQLVP